MFRLHLITTVLAVANAAPQIIRPKLNGGPAEINDHPYQVSVAYYGLHICGGTLINKNYVLTAANCVKDATIAHLYVRLGSNRRNFDGVVHKIQDGGITVHESFNPATMEFDVALLKLVGEVTPGEGIQEITYLAPDQYPIEGTGILTGWGANESGGPLNDLLQMATPKLLDATECEAGYPGKVKPSMFCTDQDACQGDYGSPLVQPSKDFPTEIVLVGIVSWGSECSIDKPGVYLQISTVSEWIVDIVFPVVAV